MYLELIPHREILKLRPTRESVFPRIILNIGINEPQDAPVQISIKGQTEKTPSSSNFSFSCWCFRNCCPSFLPVAINDSQFSDSYLATEDIFRSFTTFFKWQSNPSRLMKAVRCPEVIEASYLRRYFNSAKGV